MLKQYRTITGS